MFFRSRVGSEGGKEGSKGKKRKPVGLNASRLIDGKKKINPAGGGCPAGMTPAVSGRGGRGKQEEEGGTDRDFRCMKGGVRHGNSSVSHV